MGLWLVFGVVVGRFFCVFCCECLRVLCFCLCGWGGGAGGSWVGWGSVWVWPWGGCLLVGGWWSGGVICAGEVGAG